MKIHEHQGKELLARYDVPVPRGRVAYSVDEAVEVARSLGKYPVVVKAQIHAGGRGKGGGVKLAKSEAEVRQIAGQILGMQLITHQTGPEGKKVQRLLIEEGMDIKRELYAGLLLDRAVAQNVFMVSTEGGMDIEKVAAETPEKIVKVHIHPATGFQAFHGAAACLCAGPDRRRLQERRRSSSRRSTKPTKRSDASLLEINPLVVTGDGRVICARRQDQSSTTTPRPPSRILAMRDLSRRGRRGSRSLEIQPELHQARRQRRLHGERRGPGDGHDGHHQARTAARRPTSSTSAARPAPKRWRRASGSFFPTRM